jgi:hypothetical protein
VLKGNISSIRVLSREKGHIKIYLNSKETQTFILNVGIIHTNINGFKRHSITTIDLNREIRLCSFCQSMGHISSYCKSPWSLRQVCRKTHKTNECVHCLDSKYRCVNSRTPTRLADNRFPIDYNRLINQSTGIDGEN